MPWSSSWHVLQYTSMVCDLACERNELVEYVNQTRLSVPSILEDDHWDVQGPVITKEHDHEEEQLKQR